MQHIDVLDKGFVQLVDSLGNDLTAVNAARVSFGKRKSELDEKDIKLMRFLIDNEHHSPFRHAQVQLHIKAPEGVTRQLFKHLIGANITDGNRQDSALAWNEISRRYVVIDEFYIPSFFRKQSASNKQASQYDENGNPISFTEEENKNLKLEWEGCVNEIQKSINKLIEQGVAKEQAQMLLPIDFYTEFYYTASFQCLAHLCELRLDNHAQWEIQQYAKAIYSILEHLFPKTTEMWFKQESN